MILNIILHSVSVIIAFYLFGIFAYWWHSKLNMIYKYTCFVWLGIGITNAGAVWLYTMKYLANDFDIFEYVPTWWPWRHLIVIVPLFLYAKHLRRRLKIEKKYRHPDRNRRRIDEP